MVRAEPTGTAGLPASPAAAAAAPAVAPGAVVLLALAGVPSLVLGLTATGIPAGDERWRYLLIAVGGLLTAWALLGIAVRALSRVVR
jgi:hypothetical protein